jgi:hypothetical protein
MITRDQAERIVAEMAGSPADDPERGWELEEFSAGWYVIEHAKEGRRGGAGHVVERESGRVLSFPSAIPPVRIIEEYDQVVQFGSPEQL